jgi:tRNA pseudouridine38-40 synthase
MARYQVILAYDGTGFAGFQRQVRSRTVQGVVEGALRKLNWQARSILSAGRTDSGVHATGQVIAFDLDWAHTPGDLLRAMNAHLPPDVSARAVSQVPGSFRPRYDALSRRYAYCIICDDTRDPLRERYAWRVWPAVDVDAMQQAAGALQGKHDFGSFGTPPRARGSTVRTVLGAAWREEGTSLIFEIVADAFLYHMVRHVVALQVEIGQGKSPLQSIESYLNGKIPSPVQGLAPAHGLSLVEVCYPRREA